MSEFFSINELANLLTVAQDEDFITLEEYEKFWELVDRLPSAIIRCKDCKHWRNGHICMVWSRHGTIETKGDDFCSYGERGTDE